MLKLESVAIAVLAKAPVAGFAKTRLIPALGADGAAALSARLIQHAMKVATASAIGPVTLWCTPDESHPLFQGLRAQCALVRQPDGDLGARMHEAVAATGGPTLVVGCDCPALTAGHLRTAAEALASQDAVVIPSDDGGYVLIGLRTPQPALFFDMAWSTPMVMAETRRRLKALGRTWRELDTLWDVDTPADLERLARERLLD